MIYRLSIFFRFAKSVKCCPRNAPRTTARWTVFGQTGRSLGELDSQHWFHKKNRRKPYKKPVGGPCFPVDSVNPLIMIPVAPRKYSTCSVTCGPGTKSRNRGFQQVRVTRTRIVGWYSDRYTCFFEWQWLDGFRRYEYGMNRIEKILRWKIFTEIYKISI